MNVLILNGSPRKNGNTSNALRAIEDGLKARHTVESLNVYDFTFKPCRNCDACKRNGGSCVMPDDTVPIINKVAAADLVIFGSPVYWWGISAQLKDVVDKFYSRDDASAKPTLRTKKKIGIVACGADALSNPGIRRVRSCSERSCRPVRTDCHPESRSVGLSVRNGSQREPGQQCHSVERRYASCL